MEAREQLCEFLKQNKVFKLHNCRKIEQEEAYSTEQKKIKCWKHLANYHKSSLFHLLRKIYLYFMLLFCWLGQKHIKVCFISLRIHKSLVGIFHEREQQQNKNINFNAPDVSLPFVKGFIQWKFVTDFFYCILFCFMFCA